MNIATAGHAPAVNPRGRLSDADRALMLAVAEREWAQGKITVEEYQDTQDRCRVYPGAALIHGILRLAGGSGVARFPFGQPGDPLPRMLEPRVETIPVNSIVGSADRAAHLDRRFRPIHGGRARLESIRQAMEAGLAFPPIKVYRLHGACYVIDGHHRVAAALRIGQLYLEAVVIECWTKMEGSARPVDAAREAFGRRTGLEILSLSTPGRYEQALTQIQEHRWYLGERGRVVDLAEAAWDWYQVAYLPALQQLIAAGLVPSRGPGETGDRYFEMCDLKERISRERGSDIGFTETLRLWAGRRSRPRAMLRRRMKEEVCLA
jgi:hypothetical protein